MRALLEPVNLGVIGLGSSRTKKLAIFVPSGAAKREASALRFEKIRGCTSIAEYERAWDLCGGHPRLRWYTDFNNDIIHGLVRFRNPSNFTHPAPLRALDYPANQLALNIKRGSKLAAQAASAGKQESKIFTQITQVGLAGKRGSKRAAHAAQAASAGNSGHISRDVLNHAVRK